MPADVNAILDDLRAEQADLDRIVAPLPPQRWETPTPAEGWSVRDQISHLWYFDLRATLSAVDPARFTSELSDVVANPDRFMSVPVERGRAMQIGELLGSWRDGRVRLLDALAAADPAVRLPWYGPTMSLASFATARLMETWVHGQDIVDALGVEREPTPRLRHVAHIAVKARPFNYASNGKKLPDTDVYVAVRAPDGSTWEWNDPESADRVSGDALEFCLVTTQRRHISDTDLVVEGKRAAEWMAIAQAFAGPPGPGRRPGQFPKAGRSTAPA